jgi:hypothetical protein
VIGVTERQVSCLNIMCYIEKVTAITEREVLCLNIMDYIDKGDWNYRASGIVLEYYVLLVY